MKHVAPLETAVSVTETVGAMIARVLADCGVTTVFGVISIHNMPILDAIAVQGRIRFVPARGEAGAMSMADAYARVSGGLGVCITSTGTAAGNAAGTQVEALTAGSPVLHITTQVDREFMDRDRAAIHDVPRQADMLKAISKRFVRMWDASGAYGALMGAMASALEAPTGPVSLEIPVDVQRLTCLSPARAALAAPTPRRADAQSLATLAALVKQAKRPLLWLGGGARAATKEAQELVKRGFGVVTSTNGRAVVSESDPASLGAFNMTPAAQALYETSDLMIVVGSRLRGNETRNNKMVLPKPLVQIDADDTQVGRNYPVDLFLGGDAAATLADLLALLPETLNVDPAFRQDIARARMASEEALRKALGPYTRLADTLSRRVEGEKRVWARDVTIANSTFGNRYVRIAEPRHGVHALGGGIGQGVAMGIGAALAAGETKTITLLGDGGTQLGLSELITAVEEQANLVYVLMNDQAYGVIQNIQDAQYGSRRHYSKLRTPDFALLCAAFGLAHRKVSDITAFDATLDEALKTPGPVMIEIDMVAIGPFAETFAGPPAGAAGGAK